MPVMPVSWMVWDKAARGASCFLSSVALDLAHLLGYIGLHEPATPESPLTDKLDGGALPDSRLGFFIHVQPWARRWLAVCADSMAPCSQ